MKKGTIKKAIVGLALASMITVSLTGCVNISTGSEIHGQMTQELIEADMSYYALSKGNCMMVPQGDRPIDFNVCIPNLTDKEKNVIKDYVDELNAIFEIVNNKYKFNLNYYDSTSDSNINQDNSSVTISASPIEKENIGGYAKFIKSGPRNNNYKPIYKTEVVLAPTYFCSNKGYENLFGLRFMISHECGHAIFGFGDVYNLENFKQSTIMSNSRYYSLNDIKCIINKMADKPTSIDPIEVYKQTYKYTKILENYSVDTLNDMIDDEGDFEKIDKIYAYQVGNYSLDVCIINAKTGQISTISKIYTEDSVKINSQQQGDVIETDDNRYLFDYRLFAYKNGNLYQFDDNLDSLIKGRVYQECSKEDLEILLSANNINELQQCLLDIQEENQLLQ